MNKSSIAEIGAFNQTFELEECLSMIEVYGNPSIHKLSGGWHTSVKVFVTGEGVEFEVGSDFGHKSAKAATNDCYQRLIKAINKIKEGKH